MIKIKWFRHNHEDRNNWIRFGFMKLNALKTIKYEEWDLKEMIKSGFSPKILNETDIRHKSFIYFENGAIKKKCLIDSEDSFALFSPLIIYVDAYFCAGYNSAIFKNKQLPIFYNWQTDEETQWYKSDINKKIEQLGNHFFKVKKIIPIAPNLAQEVSINYLERKFLNIEDKIRKLLELPSSYKLEFNSFKKRYNYLLSLRLSTLKFDITLNDTLWGWPNHRIKLHNVLVHLANKGFNINSILKYAPPSKFDNSINLNLNPCQFPIQIGNINNYEEMLSSSKIGVYTCGFHWGWRNILSLSLFIGIPVITDKLLTEAYFNMNEFEIYETEDENWSTIENLLKSTNENTWEEIKIKNQNVYDKYLSPESVANYFIKECCKCE